VSQSADKTKVLEEISLIPEDKLPDIYQLLHYFGLGLEVSRDRTQSVMRFAGCWRDMPDHVFDTFMEHLADRRRQAFSRRRASEAGLDARIASN
jgi:hypothetical protein